ncbi:MAG: sigma 54-interacting transcriptional regulator [Betaproteobacteria bacterium]|nr:sigma 54-interacting transcriptional regulator [Betaproteobacteria bacterium]
MLEGFDCPAILVTAEYQIIATNSNYQKSFGDIDLSKTNRCYEISHGYPVPCDQAGEDCPLGAAKESGHKERVLHIHQTPRGKEHVDVEMLPIYDDDGTLIYFVELLHPVPLASGEVDTRQLVGESQAFQNMLAKISRVASTEASVLLLGESGTGKELAAHAVHMGSARKDKALVTLECSGLTDSLFESELFGHVKGAFTGAHSNKKGLVDLADGGTLFLDELGDVPLPMQVKLLRLIETGTFRPVGSAEVRSSDFRLVCATHKDLFAQVEDGLFRNDLYYRINVFPIHIPSLAERIEDIPMLARTLLNRIDETKQHHLTDSAVSILKEYQYRGNIRELRNLLSRAVVLTDTNVINHETISLCLDASDPRIITTPNVVRVNLKTHEKTYIEYVVESVGGDKEQAAQILGISVRSLYRKLEQ